MNKHFGFNEGSLSCAVIMAVADGAGQTCGEIAEAIDESMNLVSGTLKYLINKGKLSRTKIHGTWIYTVPEEEGGLW